MHDISTLRLYLLRAPYLLMFVGLARFQWPRLLGHEGPWELWNSVGTSMLCAICLLAALGLRYPLKMLPLLFYELTWKVIWLLAIALPASRAGQLNPDLRQTTFETLFGVILIPLLMPWKYIWRNYVMAPGDRWHASRTEVAAQSR